jgi:heme-degrading monooxygenase HmoA
MSEHLLSITSATVPPDSAPAVIEAYRGVTSQLSAAVLHTALVHGDANDWRIVTLWRSREQLEEYRRRVGTAAAIKIFRDAGAEPTVAEFDVVHEAATG